MLLKEKKDDVVEEKKNYRKSSKKLLKFINKVYNSELVIGYSLIIYRGYL